MNFKKYLDNPHVALGFCFGVLLVFCLVFYFGF